MLLTVDWVGGLSNVGCAALSLDAWHAAGLHRMVNSTVGCMASPAHYHCVVSVVSSDSAQLVHSVLLNIAVGAYCDLLVTTSGLCAGYSPAVLGGGEGGLPRLATRSPIMPQLPGANYRQRFTSEIASHPYPSSFSRWTPWR